MFLQYRREELPNTTIYDDFNNPVFRTETKTRAFMPITTKLFRVASNLNDFDSVDEKISNEHLEKYEDDEPLASISWSWPAMKRSKITFRGETMTFSQLFGSGSGFINSDGHFTMCDRVFVWRSDRLNPRLYDKQARKMDAAYPDEESSKKLRRSRYDKNFIVPPRTCNNTDDWNLATVFMTYFLYKTVLKSTVLFIPRWWFGVQHADVSTAMRRIQAIDRDIRPAKRWRSVPQTPNER